MTKAGVGLLVAAGVILLVAGAAGTAFYLKIYRPIGSPLMTMGSGRMLEEQRLQNRAEFRPPGSGEVTEEQAARFVAVEEKVQERLAGGIAVLARKQADLEQAGEAGALSVREALLAFSEVKALYLNAKMAQIDAMNLSRFSKSEFDWVRKQLYLAAGLRPSQLDVSEVLAGARDAAVAVHWFEPDGPVPDWNERLAQPLAPLLRSWLALGFFGL